MQGELLKLYTSQTTKHQGKPLYEWLLEEAQHLGIPGGSALRAIAGFGRHGRLHEEFFFEIAGDLPVLIEFFAEAKAIEQLLQRLQEENIAVFYTRLAAQGGLTGNSKQASSPG